MICPRCEYNGASAEDTELRKIGDIRDKRLERLSAAVKGELNVGVMVRVQLVVCPNCSPREKDGRLRAWYAIAPVFIELEPYARHYLREGSRYRN